jgi:peptide/nickel transport system substrate-binding protein
MKQPIEQLEEIPARPRRSLRGRLRRIERISLRHAHKFIVRRFVNLREVRRHAVGWLVLLIALSGVTIWQSGVASQAYTAPVASEGGVYTEGVFGAIDTMNPLFATTPAERSASRLLFANLLTYDENNDLVGELAQSWEADSTGKIYTLKLKANAKWQDGIAVTADDALFTFNLIKNADTRSPLYASWRNIGVEKVDNLTIKFTLPVSYAAFTSSLVMGILPHHVLKDVHPSQMRTDGYNRAPKVANGAFQFQDLTSVDIDRMHYLVRMTANPSFVMGQPKLTGFQLHAYKDSEDMPQAFASQEVAGLNNIGINQVGSLGNAQNYTRIDAPLYNGVYAFLRTDAPFFGDTRVRQALQSATDQDAILKLFGNHVQELQGPLLPGQIGYREDVKQPKQNIEKAKQLLDTSGWMARPDGKREKNGEPLKIRVVTVNSGNYPAVAEEVMRQWAQIGVEFDSLVVKPEDVQQNIIIPRAYDVLIYEIAIGRDPDVFAYWHSSQANTVGLNLSNYKSPKVDDELDSARTRLDTTLREAKYRLFVQQWVNEVPAIALYRPALTYVQNKNVVTFTSRPLVDATDRYFNVRVWAAENDQRRPTR